MRFLAIHVLIFTVIFPVNAHSAEKGVLEKPASVTADSISHNNKTGLTKAKGNVVLKYEDKTIYADEGEFDMSKKRGFMKGNVKLELPTAVIDASSMEFDLDTALGTLEGARGVVNGEIAFTAKKLYRETKTRYRMEDGTFTSCLVENPDWLFSSEEIVLNLEEMVTFKNARFRFKDVPVFYAPYWFASAVTKRKTGLLLPQFGFSSTNGAFVNNSLFWAISEQDDATFYLDAMGKRGTHEGVEYRYAFAEKTRGELDLDYINDNKLDKELWSVKYGHRHMFANGMDSRARVDMESGTSYSREYGEGPGLSSRRYTDSFLHLNDNRPDLAISLITRNQRSIEKSRGESFTRLPELQVSRLPHEIFGTSVVGEVSATASSFLSEINGQTPQADKQLNRLDLRTTLSLPHRHGDKVNVMPWVSGRSAYYSRSSTDENSISTAYYAAGIAVEGPRVFRIFNGDENSFKHSITPRLDYSYLPGYELDGANRQSILQFDELDNSDPENLLSFSLLNRVLRKGQSNSLADEIARLDIKQGFDFNEANRTGTGKRPLTDLTIDLDSRPLDWLLLNSDMTYNHYDSRADTFNVELGLLPGESIYLSFDRSYTRSPESIYSSGLIGFKPSKRVTMEASAAYDETGHEFTNSILSIGYQSCCWGVSFSFSTRKITEEDSSGAIRREHETRFFVEFLLKGIGSLGGKPAHAVERKI